nr:hypothetical protein [Deltaproteobacteria bacterium]
VAAGTALVLVAKQGATWSALQIVDAAPDVDLTETPKVVHAATVLGYEERAEPGGTLIWVQSQNQYAETMMGEADARGEAALTLCTVPAAAGGRPTCSPRRPIASWDHSFIPARDEGVDRCEVRTDVAYAASLTSGGPLTLVLASGTDDAGRAGRYQR